MTTNQRRSHTLGFSSHIALIVLVLAALTRSATSAPSPVVVTAEETLKIAAAIPDRPRVPPSKPRKLLVYSVAWGYWHTAIPYGKTMLETMARKTGAFEVTISDDPAQFEVPNLSRFDAVFFNNCNNEIFLPETLDALAPEQQGDARKRDARLKRNLTQFIAQGKGLAVIHAGVASFREWPEYGNIIGARFDNHPWNAGSTVTIKVDDPEHALCRVFPHPTFSITDEIYQFKGPYSRNRLRVLYSLDTMQTDMAKGNALHRTDQDFALGWVKSYGEGRVFYSALGHQHDLYWNPLIARHLLDGIQFVLGDLPAETTPSALRSR